MKWYPSISYSNLNCHKEYLRRTILFFDNLVIFFNAEANFNILLWKYIQHPPNTSINMLASVQFCAFLDGPEG